MKVLFHNGSNLVYGDSTETVVLDTGLACVLNVAACNRNLIIDPQRRLYACAVDKTNSHAYLFISDDDGLSWSAEQADTTALTDYRNIDMAMDSDLNIHLVWTGYSGGNNYQAYRMWNRITDAWDTGADAQVNATANWRGSRSAITVNESDECLVSYAAHSSWRLGRRYPFTETQAAVQEGSVDEDQGLVSVEDTMHLLAAFSGNNVAHRTFVEGSPSSWSAAITSTLFVRTFSPAERFSFAVLDGVLHACAALQASDPKVMRHNMYSGGSWDAGQDIVAGDYDKVSVGVRNGKLQCSFLSGTTIQIYQYDGGVWTLEDQITGASASHTPDVGYEYPEEAGMAHFFGSSLFFPGIYSRPPGSDRWQIKGTATAAQRYTLLSPTGMRIDIGGKMYLQASQIELDLSDSDSWDTTAPTDYTVAANRAGVDFYIYACQPSAGATPVFLVSANSTFPSGYTANNSRKVGGFHGLCVAVGAIGGHTLTGFVAGDILPASVWDLSWRPSSSPEGMVYDEKSNIWVDIYLASGTGASTESVYGATITDTRDWMDFVDDGGAGGKRLLTDAEFQLIAAGSNEETNIAGSADPVTTGGHSDTAGRRMISHIGCEDCAGALWQWLLNQSCRYDIGAPTAAANSTTATIYHAASPGGNPIYLKYGDEGIPYLCCNMATDTVDKIITFGALYTLVIKHDAAAAVGSYQIYFDEDATQPGRMLCALPGLKSVYVPTSNPNFPVQVVYNAAPGTPGVAVYFDDGADERLEFISPTAANGAWDLAQFNPAWTYYDLPGSKGTLYRQGTYGDVKLRAGGYWLDGPNCGSRSRYAYFYRWITSPILGARFGAPRM